MTTPSATPLSKYQFAFREKHLAAECVFIIKMLIEKANEWNIPLCFLDGDLPEAYDNILHPQSPKDWRSEDFPKFFTAAILRETRRQRVTIRKGDILSDPFSRTKSLSQGSSDAPKIFDHVFDEYIIDFVKFSRRKMGVSNQPGCNRYLQ